MSYEVFVGYRGANFSVSAGGGRAANIITADQEAGRVSGQFSCCVCCATLLCLLRYLAVCALLSYCAILLCLLCYSAVPAVLYCGACYTSLL